MTIASIGTEHGVNVSVIEASRLGGKSVQMVCTSNSSESKQSWHLHDGAPCRRSRIVNLLQAGHGPWGQASLRL